MKPYISTNCFELSRMDMLKQNVRYVIYPQNNRLAGEIAAMFPGKPQLSVSPQQHRLDLTKIPPSIKTVNGLISLIKSSFSGRGLYIGHSDIHDRVIKNPSFKGEGLFLYLIRPGRYQSDPLANLLNHEGPFGKKELKKRANIETSSNIVDNVRLKDCRFIAVNPDSIVSLYLGAYAYYEIDRLYKHKPKVFFFNCRQYDGISRRAEAVLSSLGIEPQLMPECFGEREKQPAGLFIIRQDELRRHLYFLQNVGKRLSVRPLFYLCKVQNNESQAEHKRKIESWFGIKL